MMSQNIMKTALDNGVLALSKRDREFTTFLDLKNEYHSQFITRLRQHVTHMGSSWPAIFEDEGECVKCAVSFAEKFGVEYWGSEANREKYLLKDPLQSPDSLCVYPERKDELVRVLVLLLKLKAKNWVNRTQKFGGDPTTTTANQHLPGNTTSLSLVQTPGTATTDDIAGPRRPKKRESFNRSLSPNSDKEKDPFHSKSPVLSSSTEGTERPTKIRRIRRFSDILASEQAEDKPNNNNNNSNASDNETILENCPSASSSSPSSSSCSSASSPSPSTKPEPTSSPTVPTAAPVRANMRNPIHPSALETRFGGQTFFLVRTSAQKSMAMAPVWVRFQRFPTTAAFIESLFNETKVRAWQDWNAGAQLLAEDDYNDNNNNDDDMDSTAGSQRVLAASVSFAWSGLEMRLRPDRNNDFQRLLDEIVEAWKAKVESEVPGRFFVRVTLHVEAGGE